MKYFSSVRTFFPPWNSRQQVLHLFDPPPAGVGVSGRVKKAEMCCKPELLVLPFCKLPAKIAARFPNGWEMLEPK